MAKYEQNPEQIARIDGKNCFLEVMSNSFSIGKVRINFRQYDMNAQAGNRTTGKIDIYMSFKDFDYFYQGISFNGNGYLLNELQNSQYGVTIYRGGRKNGNEIIARELKLQMGQKKPFVLLAEEGPGSENKMGGFSIIRGGNQNAIKKVMIPLELKDIVHIAVSTNNAIIAHRAAEEIKKTIKFESQKIKDTLMQIAYVVGCDMNCIESIMNREPERTWGNGDNKNNQNQNNGYNNQNNQSGYSNGGQQDGYGNSYGSGYGGYGGY